MLGAFAIRLPEVCLPSRCAMRLKRRPREWLPTRGSSSSTSRGRKNSEGGPHSGDPGPARNAPGLVHIFSVMELCSSYRPWHDKRTAVTHLRPDQGTRIYYYFYFIDQARFRPVLLGLSGNRRKA